MASFSLLLSQTLSRVKATLLPQALFCSAALLVALYLGISLPSVVALVVVTWTIVVLPPARLVFLLTLVLLLIAPVPYYFNHPEQTKVFMGMALLLFAAGVLLLMTELRSQADER